MLRLKSKISYALLSAFKIQKKRPARICPEIVYYMPGEAYNCI